MKYTPEITKQIAEDYQAGMSVAEIAAALASANDGIAPPERSVIAKLSSLGVYKKKVYTTKRGEVPIKKEEYIERIAVKLKVAPDVLESLEKVNKNVLAMLDNALAVPLDETLSRSEQTTLV